MTDATRRRRYRATDDKRILLPAYVTGAPAPVREASDRLAAAHARVAEASAAERAAKAELDQAKTADVAADREAAALGKSMPAKRSTTRAEQALDAAMRRTKAEVAARNTASIEYARIIDEHQEQWREQAADDFERSKREALEALAAATAALDRLETHREVVDGLDRIATTGLLHGVSFAGNPTHRARRREREFEQQRSVIELNGTGRHHVDRDTSALVVALALEIEGVTPSGFINSKKLARAREDPRADDFASLFGLIVRPEW